MSNIDVITQYCVYNDYPIFRYNMHKFRGLFNKIILYPSRHHGVVDFEKFARQVFPETWVKPVAIDYGVEDWRQAETIPCLDRSDSEWVWFMEQDFFVKDWEQFYIKVHQAMKDADAIGWWNETAYPYLHPSCLLIKRELLEKTQKDFRAYPAIPGSDHFATITRDIEKVGGKIVKLQDLGYENWRSAFHLGGLTYVYQDWKGDGTDSFGVGSPAAFYAYNITSRQAPIEQSGEYLILSRKIEDYMDNHRPEAVAASHAWKEFFYQW